MGSGFPAQPLTPVLTSAPIRSVKTIPLFILAVLASAVLQAAPQKLTRGEAAELYVALNQVSPGLNPANVATAADDLNALYPTVKALDTARDAKVRVLQRSQKDADFEAKKLAVQDELLGVQAQEITVDLTPFVITDDELTAIKPAPSTLATLRRLLRSPPKK